MVSFSRHRIGEVAELAEHVHLHFVTFGAHLTKQAAKAEDLLGNATTGGEAQQQRTVVTGVQFEELSDEIQERTHVLVHAAIEDKRLPMQDEG